MVAKIYAAETPVLEMGRLLKNKLSPLRDSLLKVYCDYGTLIFRNHKLGNYIIVYCNHCIFDLKNYFHLNNNGFDPST